MESHLERHPLNADGDFYVEDGCCTMCGVPEMEAPALFGRASGSDSHCFVKRQPQSPDEFDQMLNVIACAELQCIRYCGNDSSVFVRLYKLNEIDVCDNPPPPGTDFGPFPMRYNQKDS